MIYILYSESELSFSKIWAGHLELIKESLYNNSSTFNLVECKEAIDIEFLPDDIIINIGNHQYLGSEMLNGLANSIKRIGKTVFFMDDYQAPPATQLRKAITGSLNLLITNISEPIKRDSLAMFEKVFINLNRWTFNLQEFRDPIYPNSFIYWGSYRKGRDEYFSKYIKPEVYKCYVSSSDRGHDKFFNNFHNYIPKLKLDVPNELADYAFTVYMRDKKQPAACPANRFYEALSAGIPIFFDKDCIPKADCPKGINQFVVENAANIPLNQLRCIRTLQREMWGQIDYRAELIADLTGLFNDRGIL